MGNPFVHIELMTTDTDKSKSFFGKLFDWNLEDMPMPAGAYTMIRVGGAGTGGGIMHNPMTGAPSSWVPYVEVDDVKAFIDKATSLGGKLMKEVTEIPNMGSFAIINDPTGAMLGLWQHRK
jgi:predicted enzyme related to lactoylglutathione lyase